MAMGGCEVTHCFFVYICSLISKFLHFMLGTIVNALAVIVGGSIGLLLHSNLNSKYQTIYFQAVGLFTLAIGVVLLSQMQLMLPVVFALVCGGLDRKSVV